MPNLPRTAVPASKHWPAPDWHFEKIGQEMECADKTRMLGVVQRMATQDVPDLSSIDWAGELAGFPEVEYPTYYQQPFHSVPGGYLSEQAAGADRRAMEAIYEDFHPKRSLGLREELASLIPADAQHVPRRLVVRGEAFIPIPAFEACSSNCLRRL